MRLLPARFFVHAALLLVAMAVLPLAPDIAHGQTVAPAVPAGAHGLAGAPALDPAEARRLLDLLTDEHKRAAFVADLEALTKAAGPAPAVSLAPASPAASALPAAPAPPAAKSEAAAPVGTGAKSAAPPATAPAAPASGAAAPASTAAAGKPPAAEVLPLAPDSVGAEVLVSITNFLADARVRAVAAFGALRSVPALWGWLQDMATDSYLQRLLWQTSWRLAAVAALAWLAQYALTRLLGRPLAAIRRWDGGLADEHDDAPGPRSVPTSEPVSGPAADDPFYSVPADAPDPPSPASQPLADDADAASDMALASRHRRLHASPLVVLRRLPRAFAQLSLDLLPVLAFLAVAHLLIGSELGSSRGIRLILIALIDAYGMVRALMCLVRMFVSPRAPRLRLLPLSDGAARYVEGWSRWLIGLITFGYAAAETGLLFGLPWSGRQALLKTIALIGHVFVGIIILQCRRPVRRWLKPKSDATGFIALLRRRFAVSWHWIALFYDAALWIIWAIEIPDGYARIWRIFIGTSVVLLIARLMVWAALGAVEQALRVKPDGVPRHPELQERLRLYQPLVQVALFVTVAVFTVFGLLQAWGIGALTWLVAAPLGTRVLSSMATLGITLLAALAVWEAINFGFKRELERLSRQAQLARLGRLRTLLPMLRTVLLITILVIVGLMVLSEIGLNIAPLLAGAGVLGIAIGFGSQKLVQDVITGLFLLLENTMQVGDIVALGGLSGVVENLSIRTIRLRAEDGSVHVIPFSAVTTVTNQTRDFSQAVIEISIGYRDDYDRAVQVMSDIVTEMRREPHWMAEIRDELEVWGINKFSDSGVMIKCRIRCGPFARWTVGREFNRRVRSRFEAAGIYLARQGWADDPTLPALPLPGPPGADPAAALTAQTAAMGASGAASMLAAQTPTLGRLS